MQIVYERCAGLDVHKKSVVACLLFSENGQLRKERQTFSTMTQDLVRLREWLQVHDCTHVAMESTGVFWKPIYNLLEEHLQVFVVNAQHMKAVPGRKTDIKDAEWIADLLALARGRMRPKREQLTQALTGHLQPHHRFLQARAFGSY
jgi:transposase